MSNELWSTPLTAQIAPLIVDDTDRFESSVALDALFAGAPVGLSFVDTELRYTRVNECLAQINGVPLEKHIGRTVDEVLPHLAPLLPNIMRSVIETGGTIAEMEISTEHPVGSGRIRHWLTSHFAVKDTANRVIGAGSVIVEITDRKNAESKLHESELITHTITESSPDGVFLANAMGSIVYTNPAFQQLLNVTAAQLVDREWLRFVHPDDRNTVLDTWEDWVRASNYTTDFEFRFLPRVGSVRYVHMRAAPVLEGAYVQGFVGTIQDITERVKLAQTLRDANATLDQRVRERTAQLEYSNRELEAFSYSVSHDLRAPLRAVNGYAHLVMQRNLSRLDVESLEYLRKIIESSAQMAHLIDDLLRLSRIDRTDLKIALVDLSALAHRIVLGLRERHPERVVETQIQAGLTAHADPSLLQIALENLLTNAWKYTRNQPVAYIEFGLQVDHGRLAWYVRDNGIGFNMEESGYLFSAFKRLSSAQGFEGVGIGLATVRRIIQCHHGRIWAESSLGGGATFFFTLNAIEAAENQSHALL